MLISAPPSAQVFSTMSGFSSTTILLANTPTAMPTISWAPGTHGHQLIPANSSWEFQPSLLLLGVGLFHQIVVLNYRKFTVPIVVSNGKYGSYSAGILVSTIRLTYNTKFRQKLIQVEEIWILLNLFDSLIKKGTINWDLWHYYFIWIIN